MEYLKIPFDCKSIMEKNNSKVCTTDQSIKQHIHMMLTCYQGEFKFNSNFGNSVWEDEYLHVKRSNISGKIKDSLEENLRQYERRLEVSTIEVKPYFEPDRSMDSTKYRQKIQVTIIGTNLVDRSIFKHKEHFYIAPLTN